MKCFLIVIFCFVWQIGSGQISSGKIEYKVKIDQEKFGKILDNYSGNNQYRGKVVSYVKSLKSQFQTVLPYLNFTLKFNQNAAIYMTPKVMRTDNDVNFDLMYNYIGSKGSFYTNINEGVLLHQVKKVNKDWLVERDLDSIKWKITDETKIIKGYNCKKAILKNRVNSTVSFKGKTTSVWFAQEIPFQFGPMMLVGLPGLVLEVDDSIFHYYTEEISFHEDSVEIQRPAKGRQRKFREYNKERKKIAEDMKADFKD